MARLCLVTNIGPLIYLVLKCTITALVLFIPHLGSNDMWNISHPKININAYVLKYTYLKQHAELYIVYTVLLLPEASAHTLLYSGSWLKWSLMGHSWAKDQWLYYNIGSVLPKIKLRHDRRVWSMFTSKCLASFLHQRSIYAEGPTCLKYVGETTDGEVGGCF